MPNVVRAYRGAPFFATRAAARQLCAEIDTLPPGEPVTVDWSGVDAAGRRPRMSDKPSPFALWQQAEGDDSADWYDPDGEYPQICPVCSDAEFTLRHCNGGRSFCECECTSA